MAITRLGGANAITGTIPNSVLAAGNVIQVVSGIITYNTETTSTSYTDILSASGTTWETAITLSSSSNKVLILPSLHAYSSRNGNGEVRYSLIMLGKIGSASYSQIGDSGSHVRFGHYDFGGSGAILGQTYSQSFLWSPNSTDELKVKFQMKGNGGAIAVSPDNYRSVVNLLEVSA